MVYGIGPDEQVTVPVLPGMTGVPVDAYSVTLNCRPVVGVFELKGQVEYVTTQKASDPAAAIAYTRSAPGWAMRNAVPPAALAEAAAAGESTTFPGRELRSAKFAAHDPEIVNRLVAIESVTKVTSAVSNGLVEMKAQAPALPGAAWVGVAGNVTEVGGVPCQAKRHPEVANSLEILAADSVTLEGRAIPTPATIVQGPPEAPWAVEDAAPSAEEYGGLVEVPGVVPGEKTPSQNNPPTISSATITIAPTAVCRARRRDRPGGGAGGPNASMPGVPETGGGVASGGPDMGARRELRGSR